MTLRNDGVHPSGPLHDTGRSPVFSTESQRAEAIFRSERDGFRIGHEQRLNTDLEYVLLPLKYQTPGHELFAILETTYSYRDRGRIAGRPVPGSSSSECYLAPGLQFTAAARLVLEASYQFPVVLNAGPLVLRTDRNFLAGIRYLY